MLKKIHTLFSYKTLYTQNEVKELNTFIKKGSMPDKSERDCIILSGLFEKWKIQIGMKLDVLPQQLALQNIIFYYLLGSAAGYLSQAKCLEVEL